MESFSWFIEGGSIIKASIHELMSVTPTRDSNDLVVIGNMSVLGFILILSNQLAVPLLHFVIQPDVIPLRL
jgi:hypothetical protein